jgi:cysteate synthase
MSFEKTRYFLKSVKTGSTFPDSGWLLDAPGESDPTLIKAMYEHRQLTVREELPGLFRFADWLPVGRILNGSSAPVTYLSQGLAHALGLKNLYITFSGWWPEKGATMPTCSFKETEAFSVCSRLDPENGKVLVVASAGNTARAFAKVCSNNQIPLLLCVPEGNLDALWFDQPLHPCVKLVCTAQGSDYFDAIQLSNHIAATEGFIAEGGAKNIARRDGMGTTVLSAVTTIGEIPGYYFQAVGSGTGAIAAWEANQRLLGDGRYGRTTMKLMVAQNAPFHPIYDAWQSGSREMLPCDHDEARRKAGSILASVLSNRKPPYPVCGGLFDALTATQGDVLLASNDQARLASQLFLDTEGIDIHPAAAVATASLIQATENKTIDPNALIMLNITGGGELRYHSEHQLYYLAPSLVLPIDTDPEEAIAKIRLLFF